MKIQAMIEGGLGLIRTTKRTRKLDFFGDMEPVVPWAALGTPDHALRA